MLISYILWSSNHFSTLSCFPRFSGSRFFRVQVFQDTYLSGSRFSRSWFIRVQVILSPGFFRSRFFRVLVFQSPGFSGSWFFRVWGQVLEVALLICYNYSFLCNFVLIFRCPLGTLKKDFEFSEAPVLSFWKKYTFLYKNQKKIDEAQYYYYLKLLSLKMFLFRSYFVRNLLMLLGYFNTTREEFKVI